MFRVHVLKVYAYKIWLWRKVTVITLIEPLVNTNVFKNYGVLIVFCDIKLCC